MSSKQNSCYRILIMGAAGAGSTTLGRALAQRHRIPHFDSDNYYWLPTDPLMQKKGLSKQEYNCFLMI